MSEKREKRPRGRPPLPAGKRRELRNIRFTAEEWEALAVAVPEGERGEFVRRAVRQLLREEAARLGVPAPEEEQP